MPDDDLSLDALQQPPTAANASPVEVSGVEQQAAAALPARAINFCNHCGARFADDWTECLSCAERRARVEFRKAAYASDSEEPAEDDVRPVKSAIALYFAMLSISIASVIYLVIVRRTDAHVLTAEIVATIGISVIALVWAIAARRALLPLLRKVGPWWAYAAAPVLASATFIVASLVVKALHTFLHVPKIEYLADLQSAGYGFGFAMLLICVQPAVFEELAFRGVMMSALDRVLTRRESSIVVAFLFGILHLSMPSLAHLTLLGLLLAWLRRRADSLYPCMLMHFTHNLLVILSERYGWLPW